MTITWLGTPRSLGQGPCVRWDTSQPCPPGQSKIFDPQCPSGSIRCSPSPIEPCSNSEAYYDAVRGCVPIVCFPGTVRDLSTFQCVPEILPGPRPLTPLGPILPGLGPVTPEPAPGECLDVQEVVSRAPCFYLDPATGAYSGPPELVQGLDVTQLRNFCFRSVNRLPNGCLDLIRGDLPLCDPAATLPAPPSCISPEQRRVLTSCAERSYCGDDPAANYLCWIALKAPDLLLEWVRTPDCEPGEVPRPPPGAPPPVPAPTAQAEKRSLAVPLLIGAAALGAAYYFLS